MKGDDNEDSLQSPGQRDDRNRRGGCDGDDVCVQRDLAQPAPERKLDPDTLTCQEFSTGSSCNPECGPCAEGQGQGIPAWGSCESSCSTLDEAQCMAATDCRVARKWDAYYVGLPSFECAKSKCQDSVAQW